MQNISTHAGRLTVSLGDRSYPIIIENALLSRIGAELKSISNTKKPGILTNPTVGKLYFEQLDSGLKSAGFEPVQFIIPDGEEYKSLRTAEQIYKELINNRFERDSVLIALGGGVIGDLTGFIAATYLRGIPFIQIPTSLEAQVDASVGGKVAVDLPEGKNLIGAFYQPRAVFIDPDVLRTLPKRELSAGLAEVIKYGVIWDAEFFNYLEKNISKVFEFDAEVLYRILYRSCEIKSEVVARDETEQGLRAILNFGHTIGHAIETITQYSKYRHGEAIAIGMMAEAEIAVKINRFNRPAVQQLNNLIKSAGLPVQMPKYPSRELIEIMYHDKKVRENRIRMILPEKIGKVDLIEIEDIAFIEETLNLIMKG